jgi:hypothetical protein
MDKSLDGQPTESPVEAAAPPHRLHEVLKLVKLELVSKRDGSRERGRGCNPYDAKLGRPDRGDLWGRRRRPV